MGYHWGWVMAFPLVSSLLRGGIWQAIPKSISFSGEIFASCLWAFRAHEMRNQPEVTEILECKVNLTVKLLVFRETRCCTEVVVCMHVSWICLVIVGQLKTGVWVLGFLITMSRKEAKMVVMMDLNQDLFPSTVSFDATFCFHYVIQCRCWCCDQWLSSLSR